MGVLDGCIEADHQQTDEAISHFYAATRAETSRGGVGGGGGGERDGHSRVRQPILRGFEERICSKNI